MVSLNNAFSSVHASNVSATEPIPTTDGTPFGSHLLATRQAYTSIEPSWNLPIYNLTPQANMTWTDNTPAWTSNMNYTSRIASPEEIYRYAASTGPPVFAQQNSVYNQSREALPSAYGYSLDSSYEHYAVSPNQTPGMPSVSLPISSSYFQGRYA